MADKKKDIIQKQFGALQDDVRSRHLGSVQRNTNERSVTPNTNERPARLQQASAADDPPPKKK